MIAGSLLALPLTLGMAGVAMADGYSNSSTAAGPNGSASERTISGVDREGNSFYLKQNAAAGPGGAASSTVAAVAGVDRSYPVGGYVGGSTFAQQSTAAGPGGAASSTTFAQAGGRDDVTYGHDHDDEDYGHGHGWGHGWGHGHGDDNNDNNDSNSNNVNGVGNTYNAGDDD
ncbi:hypothetical protein ACOBQX_09085 [Actinokineospora sp. G85]|uniref:hypothetical protein n=1 Tax=Actinokineospora sp. G85 TaxID=3406626 RepID=UPI003C72B53C